MFFGGKAFDEVVMESSPYLSAMQTCSWLCNGMGQPVFQVNHLYCDWLKQAEGFNPDHLGKHKGKNNGEENPLLALVSRT
jgi:hypothetical protein